MHLENPIEEGSHYQYIIRGSRVPRLKTKLWLFNCLGMLGKCFQEVHFEHLLIITVPYCAVVVLNFVLYV